MKSLKSFGFIVAIFFLSGCSNVLHEHGYLTPPPAESKFFKTTGAGFIMNTKAPDIKTTYILNLDVKPGLEAGAYLEAHFEDPADPNNVIVVTKQLNPGEKEVQFESPEVHGLRAYEGYITDVFIYDNERKENLLGTHRQVIQSIIDEAQLKGMMEKGKKGE